MDAAVILTVVGSIVAFAIAAQVGAAHAASRRGRTVTRARPSFATLAPYLLWIPYAIALGRIGPSLALPDALRISGAAFAVGGVAFAIWSITVIGRHYDVELEIHADHEIVRTGPYGVVRHPIYFGLIVHTLGSCLATANPFFIAMALLAALPAYYMRAVIEERLLRERFGATYDAYATAVPMLFPRPR